MKNAIMNNLVWKFVATSFISSCIACLLISCGSKTQTLTKSSDEPKWVNNIAAGKETAKALVVGVGSAKLLDNNVDFATNKAAMSARIQIAQTVSARVEQAIKQLEQEDGLKISSNSLQAAKQKVELNLQQTQVVERWIDKSSNPQTLYVLVSMDKEAYDNALKGGAQTLNINADQAKYLSDTVEEMLR